MNNNFNGHPPKPDCHCKPNKPHCGFPDFPQFCPPPPPPPPCEPQVPSVVEGQSLYQAVNNLTNRVNLCIQNYNDVMANCYATLRNMEKAAEANGSYYGPCEVWTEEGYSAEQGSTYTLIHKACVDRRGEPIRMQLHLAYGNTTNSQIEQSIFSASKITLADKMVVAQPKGANGWYGHAIWHGAPIAAGSEPTLYTVGFTRRGTMRVYSNAVSQDQLLNDTIENAMGCSGVLIQNGQITDETYQANIPSATTQTARVVMGQNMDTQEVIILCCGSYDNVQHKGMTSKACAEILLNYGCDIAVELSEGISAGAVDKGSMVFPPMNNSVPTAYCYWYISRACLYKNDYQKELAILMQNYGETLWGIYESTQKINDLSNRLDKEIQDRIEGDNALNEALQAEIERAQAEEARLQGLIEQINTQITQINQTISEIQSDISDINEEITDIKGDITTINEQILQLSNRLTALTASVTALQQTVQSIQEDITNLESAVNTLSATVTNIINGTEVLPYLSINGGTMNGDIDMANNTITNVPTPTANADAVNKKYVDDAISGSITPPTGDYLPLTGGEMKGAIAMGDFRITNLGNATSNGDAINKGQADTLYIRKAGDTTPGAQTFQNTITIGSSSDGMVMDPESGSPNLSIAAGNEAIHLGVTSEKAFINSESNEIDFTAGGAGSPEYTSLRGIAEPTEDYDAANKKYVDQAVSGAGEGSFLKKGGDTTTGNYSFTSSNSTLTVGPEAIQNTSSVAPGKIVLNGSSSKSIELNSNALSPNITLTNAGHSAKIIAGADSTNFIDSSNKFSFASGSSTAILDGIANPTADSQAVPRGYLNSQMSDKLGIPTNGWGFTAACRYNNKIIYATGDKAYGIASGNDLAMVTDISRLYLDDDTQNIAIVIHFNVVFRSNQREYYIPAMIWSPQGLTNLQITGAPEQFPLDGSIPNFTWSVAQSEKYPGAYELRISFASGPPSAFCNWVSVIELNIS